MLVREGRGGLPWRAFNFDYFPWQLRIKMHEILLFFLSFEMWHKVKFE